MQTSLRAFLFDFDGVLADTEPVHLALFQKIFDEEGIRLEADDYFAKYLGLDDRTCFETVFRDRGLSLDAVKKESLTRRKNEALLSVIKGRSLLQPGVPEFLERVYQRYYLAVVSGALRNEVESILKEAGVARKFHLIVAADDVSHGKPDPEGFLTAVRLLNRDHVPPSEILLPEECLAIEDSPWGIEAAHKAGIKCLAVMSSYGRDRLQGADLVVPNLRTIKWEEVEGLFAAAGPL